jgi:hypothetical protein
MEHENYALFDRVECLAAWSRCCPVVRSVRLARENRPGRGAGVWLARIHGVESARGQEPMVPHLFPKYSVRTQREAASPGNLRDARSGLVQVSPPPAHATANFWWATLWDKGSQVQILSARPCDVSGHR